MIGILSKEQVAKLSPAEQELVARLALDEARSRRALLVKAKGYRGILLVPLVVCTVMMGLGMWRGWTAMLPYLVLLGFALMQFHVRGVNSRIDALVKLLDFDRLSDSKGQVDSDVPSRPQS
ncbi:hypothetical protein OKA05_29160 [Luteolibacter arcticus]|uniref:Uncharacterized protein n=1 Tax=Luteolibacter arcticus TaxID=1581411 RepID=A0ABT3GT39_9BACT|nr:hypothetical protein [Luteolibacter arcticus]MCW1926658.1 hypothetical protein [Luteolibacter arcticus]